MRVTTTEEQWAAARRAWGNGPARPEYFLGLDLGQRQDYTAMALVTPVEEADGAFDYALRQQPMVRRLRVLRLEKMRLGTPYTEVVRRVEEVTRRPELDGRCTVVADATGVGVAVVEMLRAANLKGVLTPVTITCGVGKEHLDRGVWHVPRTELLGKLVTAFGQGRLRVPRSSRFAPALVEEALEMKADAPGGGRRSEAAGVHDDLVFALALAVWKARW